MPFPLKIQPIGSFEEKSPIRQDSGKPQVLKSRFKRLFDRQFPNVMRISSTTVHPTEKSPAIGVPECNSKDAVSEFEPSSVCLAKMVKDFMEESSEKPKCGRNRCNCFHGNNNDSSDDEFDVFGSSGDLITAASLGDACEILKSLIPCSSATERNLLADTAKIIDNNKINKRKDDIRKIVLDSLLSLGYNASICKSRWDKSPSYPAGEYEYIDASVKGERLLIDIDFRSEFEIARSTSSYKTLLQSLPYIFVGKADRLQQIVSIISEAAKQSLTKKGMHFPPWRKAEYMKNKWLSNYTSAPCSLPSILSSSSNVDVCESDINISPPELIFGDLTPPPKTVSGILFEFSPAGTSIDGERRTPVILSPWQPPAIKQRSIDRGARVVTGLASLLTDKS